MNVALIGYGKMGKEVEQLARARGTTVIGAFDIDTPPPSKENVRDVDVGIHFAVSSAVVKDVELWSSFGKNLVIGTTGWDKDRETVKSIVAKMNTGLIYASNFSIGVNLLHRLARQAAGMVNALPEYDIAIQETHHKEKIDSPSGTALSLANLLIALVRRKNRIMAGSPEGKIDPEQLHISSTRTGTVIGTHTIIIDSAADTIELTHRAKNRSGFALGALLAAQWIVGKRGVFTIDDVFKDILE